MNILIYYILSLSHNTSPNFLNDFVSKYKSISEFVNTINALFPILPLLNIIFLNKPTVYQNHKPNMFVKDSFEKNTYTITDPNINHFLQTNFYPYQLLKNLIEKKTFLHHFSQTHSTFPKKKGESCYTSLLAMACCIHLRTVHEGVYDDGGGVM